MRRQGPLGPPPPPTSPGTSRSMKSNRGRDTGPELRLRKALRDAGLRGFRTNFTGAPGRPDIAFPSARVAVMVYGDFWHRCPKHRLPLPKAHRDFWLTKFALNRGKEAERKRNPKLQDMTLVVRGYEAASFRDVWSMLARVALSDEAGFAGLATLIYRCAFHLDHEVEDRRLRYKPGPPTAAFIGDLGGRLGALLPDGNVWALLHFLDMLGWNEDVKYHFEEGRATFTGKYDNFMTGR